MTSAISGAGAYSSAVSMQSRGPSAAKMQQDLLAKLDSNGDSAIDKSELQSFMDFVSDRTSTATSDTDALFGALDTDGDGSVTGTELADNGKSLFDQLRNQLRGSEMGGDRPPPPSGEVDELFETLDANGDGSIDKSELTSFLSDAEDASATGVEAQSSREPQIGRLIASLLEQYSAVGAANSASSATSSLSAVA